MLLLHAPQSAPPNKFGVILNNFILYFNKKYSQKSFSADCPVFISNLKKFLRTFCNRCMKYIISISKTLPKRFSFKQYDSGPIILKIEIFGPEI